jgi:uncharacterized damage-inducible protein DinB
MNRALLSALVLGISLFANGAFAEEPVLGAIQFLYEDAKRNVIESAEKADEAIYGFKPADETRTLAQQLTHVADTNYLFCSSSRRIENPHPGGGPGAQGTLEKTLTSKVDIVAAVKASFAFCDEAFAQATDASLAEMVELTTPDGSSLVPRASMLGLAAYHGGHHYGSIATYLRLNGMVPPSTERSLAQSESSANE